MLGAMTVAALLIAFPSSTDADRIAANGGFLVGNAHRCGMQTDRVVRAGDLVRGLIAAAAESEKAQSEAELRFAEFFLVSALADPKKEKLVASCKAVTAELAKLEQHQATLTGSSAEKTGKPRPGDGE